MNLLEYGYGLHLGPNEYFVGDRLRPYLEDMRAMGMSVLTTQNKDPYTYQLCREYGFDTVLFRPMLYCTELYEDLSGIEGMKQHGYRAMVQPYNEPSDTREWPDSLWPSIPIWIDHWIDAAQRIHHAGGYPGVQCLDPQNELRPLLQEIKRRKLDFLFERMWMSVHNYPNNHPPKFPYDPVNAGQYTVYEPGGYLSFLVPLAFDKVFREETGRSVDTYCTEGGWTVGDDADNRYPKVTVELHRDYTLEVVRAFKAGKLPTGEPWPKWLKGFTFWLAASTAMQGPMDFEANAWYRSSIRDPYTTLTPTIDGLKELSGGETIRPTFEDGPVEPAPPEPEPEVVEGPILTLKIAFVPSCQQNRGLNGYIEGETMRIVGDMAAQFANSLELVEAETFWFGLDSPPHFPLLVRQLSEAQEWLDNRAGPDTITLAVNVHTDSGKSDDPEWPHVIGAYRREADNESWRLASICARHVDDILNTDEVLIWDYTGYMFDRLMSHTTCLIEAGNHQSYHCMDVLGNEDGLRHIAEALVYGCLEYAEITAEPKEPEPEIDWRELSRKQQRKLDKIRAILDE